MSQYIGQQLGAYRLTRLLGIGGFAEVYLGKHVHNNWKVAVKVLKINYSAKTFSQEANILWNLRHPHIVEIKEFNTENGVSYLVMDYAARGSLRDVHAVGETLIQQQILIYIKQIADALDFIHNKQPRPLVHCDIKPQNFLMKANGAILLGDFGIATEAITDTLGALSLPNAPRPIVGTLHYIAPEQWQGLNPTPTTDQYALGVVVYEWLSGRRPFTGTNAQMIALAHTNNPPPPFNDSSISAELEDVVMRALAKDPSQRFPSILDFAQALEDAIQNRPIFPSPQAAPYPNTPPNPIGGGIWGQLQSSQSSYTPPSLAKSYNDITTPYTSITYSTPTIPFQPQKPQLRNRFFALFRQSKKSAVSSSYSLSDRPLTTASTNPSYPNYHSRTSLKDFFISYNKADLSWAKWIKWHLDKARYSTVLLPWNIRSDSNFESEIKEMETKIPFKRIILVISDSYLNNFNTQEDFFSTFKEKVTEEKNKFLPICVQECGDEFKKLLNSINHIDLSKEDEITAAAMLLAAARYKGIELTTQPAFPGEVGDKAPTFPGKGNSLDSSDSVHISTSSANQEALHLTPNDTTMLALQQQNFAHVQSTEKEPFQTKSQFKSSSIPPISTVKTLKVFFSYSQRDARMRHELEAHLRNLKRQYSFSDWYDGEIGAGNEWAKEIDTHLSEADIVLLLVTKNFFASHYCYEVEMKRAIERHKKGEARVIPIILSSTHWEGSPLGQLQALPTGGKAITLWPNRDAAFVDVAIGIEKVVKELAGGNLPG